MTLAELNPDEVLASILDNRITVHTSKTESHAIRCYADGKMPNIGLGDEFVSLMFNGEARSLTRPVSCFKGILAMTVYCRTHNNGTAMKNRINGILGQCQELGDDRTAGGFYFSIVPSRVVTPLTVNESTGYSMKTINIEWRTV